MIKIFVHPFVTGCSVVFCPSIEVVDELILPRELLVVGMELTQVLITSTNSNGDFV